ncbi:hypothetical protein VaNZ11_000718 [Volvox africanus]|uniref:Major facilitator superfamily (MFS) profile domain-containing protein n=1 Tax=Volvox africanus TaxID=51714 RepID=A0ABQ5RMY7_9CHLO|nr:hypothetical protein VaNZ11_000718 [Volvox africanus]
MVAPFQDKKYTDKLPWQQVLSLSSANFSQAVMLTTPFTVGVFMVRDFQAARYGGREDAVDEQVVGRLTGLLAGIFSFSSFLTAYAWGCASNYIGRKPVIVLGNAVSFVSMLWFGMSGSYANALAARAFGGFFNGILGAWKCMIGESTDVLLQGKFFGYMSLAWGLGCIAGPALGGAFSRPCSRLPYLTLCGDGQLLRARPYFLACAVGGLTILGALLLSVFMLEETLPKAMMDKSLMASLRRRRERRRLLHPAEEEEDANFESDLESESSLDLGSSAAGACVKSPQKGQSGSVARKQRRWGRWGRRQEPVAGVLAPGEGVDADVENGKQPALAAANRARTEERAKLLSAHTERSHDYSSCPHGRGHHGRQPRATFAGKPPCTTSARRQDPGLPSDTDVDSDANSETASACRGAVIRASSCGGGATDSEDCNPCRRRLHHRHCIAAANSRTPLMMRLQGLLRLASRTYIGINPFTGSSRRRSKASNAVVESTGAAAARTASPAETDIELLRCRKPNCDVNHSSETSPETGGWSKAEEILGGELEGEGVKRSCLGTCSVQDRNCHGCSGGHGKAQAADEEAAGGTTNAISAAAAPAAAAPIAAIAMPEESGHDMLQASAPPQPLASGVTSESPGITGTGGIGGRGGSCEEAETDMAVHISTCNDSVRNSYGGSAAGVALARSPARTRGLDAPPSEWASPAAEQHPGVHDERREGPMTGREPRQDAQPEDHLGLTLPASRESCRANRAGGTCDGVSKDDGKQSSGCSRESRDEARGAGGRMVECSLLSATSLPADAPYPHGPSAVAAPSPSSGSRMSNARGEYCERGSMTSKSGHSGAGDVSVLSALATLPEDSSLHGAMAFPAAEHGGGRSGALAARDGLGCVKQPDGRLLASEGDDTALPGEGSDMRQVDQLDVDVAVAVVEGEEPKRLLPWFRHPQVVLTVLGYGATALIFCAIDEVFPIFASAPRTSSGLGMREEQIAPPLMFFGAVLMPYSLYVYPPLQRRVGTLRLTRMGLAASVMTCILIPLVADLWTASAIFAQVFLYFAMVVKAFAQCNAFTGSIIAVNAAPSQEQLGAVNGVGQTLAALVRGVGPALGGLLWAVSLGLHSAGQQFLTFGLIAVVAAANFGLYGFVRLPNMR